MGAPKYTHLRRKCYQFVWIVDGLMSAWNLDTLYFLISRPPVAVALQGISNKMGGFMALQKSEENYNMSLQQPFSSKHHKFVDLYKTATS